MRHLVAFLALLLAASPPGVRGAASADAGPDTAPAASTRPGSGGVRELAAAVDTAPIIVLVRHAEKSDDDPEDPSLTDEGRRRAEALARLLGRSGVTAVLSSDYRRTRDTAGPLARAAGVGVEIYDPASLEEVAEGLLERRGLVVVVGHSDTTPDLVARLGGDPGSPIDEDEYDRLYVVHPAEEGATGTLLLRFGS